MKQSELSLDRLLPYFLMNYNLIDDVSLMYGKMGGVIFFNMYMRYTGVNVYRDYADLLLDDIYKQINTMTPINFADGLCGIGWGVEYLVQNQFYEGCTDELLSDIDDVIIRSSPETLDHTFMTGIEGLLLYVISRVKSFKRSWDQIPFDLDYMVVLYSNRAKAHPLEIFLVILIAGSLAGVLGMLLAIPAYNVIRVFAKEFFNNFRVVQKLTEKI